MKLKIIFLVATCGFTSSAWAKFIESTDITSYVNQLIKQQKSVSLKNIKHDKANKTSKNSWCFDYKKSPLIKFN